MLIFVLQLLITLFGSFNLGLIANFCLTQLFFQLRNRIIIGLFLLLQFFNLELISWIIFFKYFVLMLQIFNFIFDISRTPAYKIINFSCYLIQCLDVLCNFLCASIILLTISWDTWSKIWLIKYIIILPFLLFLWDFFWSCFLFWFFTSTLLYLWAWLLLIFLLKFLHIEAGCGNIQLGRCRYPTHRIITSLSWLFVIYFHFDLCVGQWTFLQWEFLFYFVFSLIKEFC